MILEQKEYELILENSPNMVWRAGKDAKCNYFNKTWLEFTGRIIEEEIGDGWAEGVHPDDFENCLKIYTNSFSKRKSFEMDYRLLRHDGKYRIINDRGVPYYSESNEFLGYIGSCMDITEKVEGELLKQMAIYDGLTQLFDRQYFIKILKEKIDESKTFNNSLSIIMIDVDKFKYINDSYGHNCGDEVLKFLANTINNSIREDDFAGRYGGDEFMICLTKTKLNEALNVSNRICELLEKNHFNYNGLKIKIEVSIGLIEIKDSMKFNNIIDQVDKLMYKSKEKKGNYVTFG